jgi:hypothetical protein
MLAEVNPLHGELRYLRQLAHDVAGDEVKPTRPWFQANFFL